MAVALLVIVGADAQIRRRPVRRGVQCVTPSYVTPGFVGTYLSITNEGSIGNDVTWIEDGPERTRTLQEMHEPLRLLDVDATLEYEVVASSEGSLVGVTSMFVRSVTRFGPEKTIDATTTFLPSHVLRPVSFCEGARWTIASSNMTTMTESSDGQSGTVIATTPGGEGRVVDIRAMVLVPAGTFETVHWFGVTIVNGGLFRTENWTARNDGFLVRQIVFGPDQALIQTTELMSYGEANQ